ncbi:hypothetical protein VSX64_18045 [Aurantimonas sp. C2-6-R+9]|uniref:hypothetical protein n=1 Tax=unclassified Aurantimonas TaxID=2638230 RepID=UPI002E18CE94|nr:hypothetical protein [Aurantimonas sp. C2-6-R+9]
MRRLLAFTLALSLIVPASADYLDHITGAESGGDYAVFNHGGHTKALGRYQFIPSTFADLGYLNYTSGSKKEWSSYSFSAESRSKGISSVNDLRHSDAGHRLQDEGFNRFTNRNWSSLTSSTRGAVGSTIEGAPVTQNGLLSMSHFLGAGGTNKWVQAGFDASALPWNFVTANGFSSYAELNNYLLGRMADAAGSSWDGGSGGSMVAGGYGQDGMYSGTAGFPGFGSKRPTLIEEMQPFQGERQTLGGGDL